MAYCRKHSHVVYCWAVACGLKKVGPSLFLHSPFPYILARGARSKSRVHHRPKRTSIIGVDTVPVAIVHDPE